MNSTKNDLDWYRKKRVLITGHTGFKGSWLTLWLKELKAEIIGVSIDDGAPEGVFQLANLKNKITHFTADVNDISRLKSIFEQYQPEIVFHLAAQALVMKSYENPVDTFQTNILGTAKVLECIRNCSAVKAAVIITSDKCYKNKESKKGYVETDELGGMDPYSASKSCAEIIIQSYAASFFDGKIPLASTRAGNIIGGGDWAEDRIIPDAIRALQMNRPIPVRNPTFVRPWQHVLEPVAGYLQLGATLYNDQAYSGAWNFGPSSHSLVPVQEVAAQLISLWGNGSWKHHQDSRPYPETKLLSLDSHKAQQQLGWVSKLGFSAALKLTAEWYKQYREQDVYDLCQQQINFYQGYQALAAVASETSASEVSAVSEGIPREAKS